MRPVPALMMMVSLFVSALPAKAQTNESSLTPNQKNHIDALIAVCAGEAMKTITTTELTFQAKGEGTHWMLPLPSGETVEVTPLEAARQMTLECFKTNGPKDPVLAPLFRITHARPNT